jgi:hypothetical protein
MIGRYVIPTYLASTYVPTCDSPRPSLTHCFFVATGVISVGGGGEEEQDFLVAFVSSLSLSLCGFDSLVTL